MSLLSGESVTLLVPTVTGEDELGEPLVTYSEQTVYNVIVAPGATSGPSHDRPHGAEVACTLHFPKGYTGSLKGCLVDVRGERFRVIGDPMSYSWSPLDWDRVVEVAREDG